MFNHVVSYDMKDESNNLIHVVKTFSTVVAACSHFNDVKNNPSIFGKVTIGTKEKKYGRNNKS